MLVDADKTLDCTVTVYNRVSAQDVGTKTDIYVRTVLHPCNWQSKVTRSVSGDGTLAIAESVSVQVPSTTANYVDYVDFVAFHGAGDYTASTGDVWVFGEGPEATTKTEVNSLIKTRPHFVTSTVRDLRNQGGVSHGSSGIMKYASVVVVEGV